MMGTIIKLKDGSLETIFNEEDLIRLIEEHMGREMKEAVIQWVNEVELAHGDDEECIHELNELISEDRAHHKEVMKEMDEVSAVLATLIAEPAQDRKAISEVAGKLRKIIRRERR